MDLYDANEKHIEVNFNNSKVNTKLLGEGEHLMKIDASLHTKPRY